MFLVGRGEDLPTDRNKLEKIEEKIRSLMVARLKLLRDEASILAADMDALTSRIDANGHRAQVTDMKAGRWYRTASDLRLLQQIYAFVCDLGGKKDDAVPAFVQRESSEGASEDPSDVDEVSDD